LKRHLWFADVVELPPNSLSVLPHLGLELLKYDLATLLLDFCRHFTIPPLAASYLSACSAATGNSRFSDCTLLTSTLEILQEMHEGSFLPVYLVFLRIIRGMILEDPERAASLAILRAQWILKLHELRTRSSQHLQKTLVDSVEGLLSQEPFYKSIWCLDVCTRDPQAKLQQTLPTLLRELKLLARLEHSGCGKGLEDGQPQQIEEAHTLADLGHLLAHPAYLLTLLKCLRLIAQDIATSLAPLLNAHQQPKEESFLAQAVDWPHSSLDKLDDFCLLYRMLLLSQSFVAMWREKIYFLPQVPPNFFKSNKFYTSIYFRLFDESCAATLEMMLQWALPGEQEHYFEHFTNLKVDAKFKGDDENENEAEDIKLLLEAMQQGPSIFCLPLEAATRGGFSIEAKRGFNIEKSLIQTLMLDWLSSKPLTSSAFKALLWLNLSISRTPVERSTGTAQELYSVREEMIKFWTLFIDIFIKHRYQERSNYLVVILCQLFTLFDKPMLPENSTASPARTLAYHSTFWPFLLLKKILEACRLLAPRLDKDQVKLLYDLFVEYLPMSPADYQSLYSDLRFFIQYAQ
jgi:hypothetical protein